jgi:hypothetical protein
MKLGLVHERQAPTDRPALAAGEPPAFRAQTAQQLMLSNEELQAQDGATQDAQQKPCNAGCAAGAMDVCSLFVCGASCPRAPSPITASPSIASEPACASRRG